MPSAEAIPQTVLSTTQQPSKALSKIKIGQPTKTLRTIALRSFLPSFKKLNRLFNLSIQVTFRSS